MNEYEVSVACLFEATSPHDAVEQMIHWLQEQASQASYLVERTQGPSDTVLIDADTDEFREYLSNPDRMD